MQRENTHYLNDGGGGQLNFIEEEEIRNLSLIERKPQHDDDNNVIDNTTHTNSQCARRAYARKPTFIHKYDCVLSCAHTHTHTVI